MIVLDIHINEIDDITYYVYNTENQHDQIGRFWTKGNPKCYLHKVIDDNHCDNEFPYTIVV